MWRSWGDEVVVESPLLLVEQGRLASESCTSSVCDGHDIKCRLEIYLYI